MEPKTVEIEHYFGHSFVEEVSDLEVLVQE